MSAADGEIEADIDISYVPFFYQGAVTGLIVLATDVTQRNQAAVSLARSEATQRALLAALPGIYLRLSPGGRVTALFGRTSEILGISSGEEIEQRWRDLNLSPEFSQLFSRIEDIDWSCSGVYEVHALEQRVSLRGETHHIEARVAWPPGTADRVCLLLDVTRRVEAEARLASSQSLLAAVTTHAPIGILVMDAQDQVLFANAKAKERIAELQTFVRRFSANASKARQATSRARQIEKIQLEDVKPSSRVNPYIRLEQNKKLPVERVLVNRVLPKTTCTVTEERRKNELEVAKVVEKKIGLPVTRSSVNISPVLFTMTTAGTVLPSRTRSISRGADCVS